LVATAKFLVAATKKIFVVPNFVAVTKPFFRADMDICRNNSPAFFSFSLFEILKMRYF